MTCRRKHTTSECFIHRGGARIGRPQHRKGKAMRIKAVCVCDGYGDFLRYTLPQMQIAFDYLLVVTSKTDSETAAVCSENETPCIKMDAIRRNGRFEKGRAINRALEHFGTGAWIAQIDADIWLPSTFGRLIRAYIELVPSQDDCIFGCRRRIVRGFSHFKRFRNSIQAVLMDRWRATEVIEEQVIRDGCPLPIGYLQMWHPGQSGIHSYCEGHTRYEIEDARFALQWGVARRIVCGLPVYHLQTERHYPMQDWNGRRQPRFGPEMSDGRA